MKVSTGGQPQPADVLPLLSLVPQSLQLSRFRHLHGLPSGLPRAVANTALSPC